MTQLQAADANESYRKCRMWPDVCFTCFDFLQILRSASRKAVFRGLAAMLQLYHS